MQTIIIAVVILLVIVLLCVFINAIHERQQKKQHDLLLKKAGDIAAFANLRFTSQEVLHQYAVIGMDGMFKKLLWVETLDTINEDHFIIIHLEEVSHCTVKKINKVIYNTAHRRAKPEGFLNKISLRIEFNNGKTAEELLFYKSSRDSMYDAIEMEQRAIHWEQMIIQMIHKPIIKRA